MGEAPPYKKSLDGETRLTMHRDATPSAEKVTVPLTPGTSQNEEYQDLNIQNLKDSLKNHQMLRRENEKKARFLEKMDSVYYRIRDLRDILEEDTLSTENVTVSEPQGDTSPPPPLPNDAQDATQSPKKVVLHPPPSPTRYTLTPAPHPIEKSSCYSSNADQSNTLVWGALRYLGTEVHRGTTLGNVELCSELNTADESKYSHPPPTPPATKPPTQNPTRPTRSQNKKNNVTVQDPLPTTPGGTEEVHTKSKKMGKIQIIQNIQEQKS